MTAGSARPDFLRRTVASLTIALLMSCLAAAQQVTNHNKQFWKSTADNKYRVSEENPRLR